MYNFLFYVEREFHFYLFKNLIQYIQKHSLGRVAILSPPYQPSTIKSPNYGMRRELAGDLLWLDEQKLYRKLTACENHSRTASILLAEKDLYRKLPACENHIRTASILLAENSYKQDACSTEDCQLAENVYKQDACSTESYKPDIVFIADSSYEKVEGLGFIVNIGHGTICKGSFFTDKPLSYRENCADLLCVPGVVHEKIMKKYLINSPLVAGMPKLDSVFTNSETPEQAKKKLGLNPLKKTILIAPTFNQEFSLISLIGSDIRSYLSDAYNVIFKLHGVSPMEQKELLQSLTVDHE
nr:CDP-glycerol glycerophosphotransferase family protein [Candidatus Cloacimonadota bacterium]